MRGKAWRGINFYLMNYSFLVFGNYSTRKASINAGVGDAKGCGMQLKILLTQIHIGVRHPRKGRSPVAVKSFQADDPVMLASAT